MLCRSKIVKTVLLFMIFLSKGLNIELSGPAMMDLRLIFSTDYASLTRAIAGRGIGGIVGALMGGIVADKFESHLDLCTGMFGILAAAILAYIPYTPSMDYLWCLYFGQGLSNCVLNICITRQVLELWQGSNTGILQMIHTAYGVGALLTPLVCAPFLAKVVASPDNTIEVIQESRVQIPFLIVASFTLILAISLLLSQGNRDSSKGSTKFNKSAFVTNPRQINQRTFLQMINPASYAGGNARFGWLMVSCLVVYNFNLMGCEKVFGSFIRTFSIDALKFDTLHASYLNTLFWVSFTFGRFFTVFSSRFLHIKTLIVVQVLIHIVSVTLLKYYFSTTSGLFWVGTFIEGFTVSPLYGLSISFGSTQMEMSGMMLTVGVLAACIGDWTYLKAAGRLYDSRGPAAILDVIYTSAWIVTGTVGVMWMAARKTNAMSKTLTA